MTADGLALYWQSWRPDAPHTALLFVHGLAEHSGRYRFPVDYFAPQGFACWAFDQRAHGRSPGAKVHVARFEEFLEDLRTLLAHVRAAEPGLPVYLVGHSYGGLVVLSYALRFPEGLPGLIVSSPFLAAHPAARPSALLAATARLLSVLAPSLRVPSGVPPESVSHDPQVVAAYRSDPLVSSRVSSRWFTETRRAQAAALESAAGLRVPALVMAAGADLLVDPDATRRFCEAVPAGIVEHVRWDGLYHELLNEPEREAVFRRMRSWLQARPEAAAAGPR